ncbi:lipase/acyltransferase domain-containing protein [Actinophytocola sp.]|uniref:lipase/acyltransferase domain-containing protein n=1 Tax=Actinophytocola sp. TaxID=1872138 RepID=UPI00389AC23F
MTRDAVIVVPGLMGSALYDTVDQRFLWGLEPGWYVRAWSPIGRALTPLAVTDEERDGHGTRVVPRRLEFTAFSAVLGGISPYGPLLRTVRTAVIRPDAVLEFPYDWRLPVAHNARLLAEKIDMHLGWWRAESGNPDARVVLVAHSMGGLLCRHLHTIPGATDHVRDILTLGTPFGGTATVAAVLGSGVGGRIPLPAQRLRRVAVTMPGLYDLLPTYRSVLDGTQVRHLTAGDLASLGADRDLADTALHTQTAQRDTPLTRHPLTRHHAVIGVEQATTSSLTLADGLATGLETTFHPTPDGDIRRHPDGRPVTAPGLGDGTVPRNAALPAHGTTPIPAALHHMPLARADTALTVAHDIVAYGAADTGPRLGPNEGIGLRLPDIVAPHREWTAELTGTDALHATVTVVDVETNIALPHGYPHRRDGAVHATISLPKPGLYRVQVTAGPEPVTQYVLAENPDATE